MSEENKNTRQDKLPEVEIDTSKPKKDTAGGEAVLQKSKFARWLENFFYHYKWHTAAVAFILIVAIVCTATMCGRKKPDIQMIYVGSKPISSDQQRDLMTGLGMIRNKGEEITITPYQYLTPEQINELNTDNDENNNPNELYLLDQFENFNNLMMLGAASTYFIWFMSPDIYEYYVEVARKKGDVELLFTNLDFLESESGVSFYDNTHTAIKLSNLNAYYKTELLILPDDTLVVLRAPSGVSSKKSKKAYEASREYLVDLVKY